MIICFSGTGNSKYIARLLAAKLDDTLIDAAALIKSAEHPEFTSEKPYVFVAPVYAWRLPKIFGQWLKGCSFEGNKKAYFALTCGGEIGAAGNYAQKLTADLGLEYMGIAEIVMPENYIVMFSAPPKDEDEGIISSAVECALTLTEKIASCRPLDRMKTNLLGHIYSDLINPLFYTFYIGAKKFYTTDKCISCGKCVTECMLNNITLVDGRPVWGDNCTHCMACICKCPTEAIEYGKHTVGLRRYTFPEDYR